jgi:hypothetical protein
MFVVRVHAKIQATMSVGSSRKCGARTVAAFYVRLLTSCLPLYRRGTSPLGVLADGEHMSVGNAHWSSKWSMLGGRSPNSGKLHAYGHQSTMRTIFGGM